MQKARRLACSKASVSSPSNTSLNLRGRSRASSAGGDYVEASKSNIPADPFESKFKLRKRNNKARTSSKNGKKTKKTTTMTKKAGGKLVRPTFGSLQNTVVLAPFHTLKKCFQTKLVDLYLNEKIKKNNNKTKMAEKQNMLFEYDVMELKPLEEKNGKKEKKGLKVKKGVRSKDKEPKSNRKRSKSRKSQSYCQCEKTNPNKSKEQRTNPPKDSSSRNQTRKPEKRNFQASVAPNNYQRVFSIPGPEESKRRRIDGPRITNLSPGPEYEIMPDLLELNTASCSEPRSETNLSFSNVSSRSKLDSWETISDSPSYRVFEGSLAISTTSFGSCLEQYERDSCNYSEQSGVRSKSSETNSRYNTRLKALKEKSGGLGNRGVDFIVNLADDDSGQYITNKNVSNSDGQLKDFMDREPQTQIISSSEMTQHLQPLRRKSKSQTRKSTRENDSSKAYFLRSQSGSTERFKTAETEERTFLGEYRNDDGFERNGHSVAVSKVQDEGGSVGRVENNVEPVTVSCEGNTTLNNLLSKDKANCQSQADLSQTPSKLSSSTIDNTTNCSKVPETDDEVKRSSSQKDTNLNLNVGTEPPSEVLHKRKPDTKTDEQTDCTTNKSPEMGKTDLESEERIVEEAKLGDFDDQSHIDLLPAPETVIRFQESSDVDRHVSHQPQDKEPSFIFGPRTTSDRLGESCEFSFGLNWVLSDDDNSEHGDHFL